MNIYLLRLLGKWLSLVVVGALSLFQNIGIDSHQMRIDNR